MEAIKRLTPVLTHRGDRVFPCLPLFKKAYFMYLTITISTQFHTLSGGSKACPVPGRYWFGYFFKNCITKKRLPLSSETDSSMLSYYDWEGNEALSIDTEAGPVLTTTVKNITLKIIESPTRCARLTWIAWSYWTMNHFRWPRRSTRTESST